jgi:hypothetical protein
MSDLHQHLTLGGLKQWATAHERHAFCTQWQTTAFSQKLHALLQSPGNTLALDPSLHQIKLSLLQTQTIPGQLKTLPNVMAALKYWKHRKQVRLQVMQQLHTLLIEWNQLFPTWSFSGT